ncbi:hypothetical protein CRG98_001915 [Punica granatum]|uniref:Uncharacterized protein n=1 Tax=Punica granatum TaxID=22663 RepID=A0A2I0LAI1_PUNGR|nr:hypothetical protein CRG98_001915 [Punica granatum]
MANLDRDVPLLSTRRVDWNFLGAVVSFLDPIHAVFNIQGTELTPTIEEYRTLIGRTAVTHADRIDAALASVVLQVVGGHEYETVHEDTTWARFEHTWREDQTSVNHQSDIEQVLDAWRTVVIERTYFPEHPTLEEQDFQATEEYVLRFYRWGPTTHKDFANSSRAEDSGPTGASLTPNAAIQAELANLRVERDRLRRGNHRERRAACGSAAITERARPSPRQATEARANVALERFRKRARGGPRTP